MVVVVWVDVDVSFFLFFFSLLFFFPSFFVNCGMGGRFVVVMV